MIASRWEKERSAWLLGKSRSGTSLRRKAELLGRTARRQSRSGSGVAAVSVREDVTPGYWTRSVNTDEGLAEKNSRMLMLCIGFVLGVFTIGPAVALAAGMYGVMWTLAPKIGRLWSWPWIVAGLLLAAAGVMVASLSGMHDVVVLTSWPVGAVINGPAFLACWLWIQFALALILTGVQIALSGWAAVPRGAVPKSEKDKHGNFRVTADKQKIKLDPYAGEAVATSALTNEPGAKPEKIKLALSYHDPEEPEPEFYDDDIVADTTNHSEEKNNV